MFSKCQKMEGWNFNVHRVSWKKFVINGRPALWLKTARLSNSPPSFVIACSPAVLLRVFGAVLRVWGPVRGDVTWTYSAVSSWNCMTEWGKEPWQARGRFPRALQANTEWRNNNCLRGRTKWRSHRPFPGPCRLQHLSTFNWQRINHYLNA